jgi:MoaA/NifB/PqqE/SkfB family radical SAM enzyme
MGLSRAENLEQNAADFRLRRLVLNSYPTMVYVELTQNCNGACRMCRGRKWPYDPALNMSDDLFDRISDEIFPSAGLVDLRGWGESTLLPNFSSYLKRTVSSGVRVRLVTNGIGVRNDVWEALFAANGIVGVSVDSPDPEVYNHLGRGEFSDALASLTVASASRRKCGRGELYLKAVVSSLTLESVPRLFRFAADLGIATIVLNPIRCSANSCLHLSHVASRIPPVLDAAASLASDLGMTLRLGSAFGERFAVNYGLPTTCPNPWSHVLIDYQGYVGFCDHMIGLRAATVARWSEGSFKSIWNGPGFQEVRRMHTEAQYTRTVPGRALKCSWCYSNRYLESEHAQFPELTGREVSNRTGLPLYARCDSMEGRNP